MGLRKPWAVLDRCDRLSDPQQRYVDLAVRFRVKGTAKTTKRFGGVWDKWGGRWAVGRAPKVTKVYWVSARQLPFILAPQRRVMGLGGRGGGKSEALARRCVSQLLAFPTKTGQVISPTHGKARILWRKLLRIIPRSWLLPGQLGIKKTPPRELIFVTGARIQFLSADSPGALRGEDLAWVVLDESQDITQEAWDVMFLSLREAGDRFSVAEVGTPQMGVFYERYLRYEKDEKEGHSAKILRFPSRSNPFISHALFDEAERLLDARRVKQEIEALFVAQTGLVHYNFDRRHHVREVPADAVDVTARYLMTRLELELEDGETPPQWLIGVDYGTSRNWAVIYKIFEWDGAIVVWAIDSIREDGTAEMLAAEVKRRGYFPGLVIDDASEKTSKGGFAGAAAARANGFIVDHPGRNPHISDRVAAICGKFRNYEKYTTYYVHPRCDTLIVAFENQELGADGKPDKTKGYDHIADAAGYPIHWVWPPTEAFAAYEDNERLAA